MQLIIKAMNFQDIPIIFEILEAENLKPLSAHEGDKLTCVDSNGNKYFMKDCRGIEGKVFETVFPLIRQQNLQFRRLQLPEHRNIVSRQITEDGVQKQRDFIFINHYTGTTFNSSWNETSPVGYGGRGINISMAEKVVGLLEDFSLIDTALLNTFSLPTFSFTDWKSKNLPLKADNLIKANIVTQDQIDQATSILSSSTLFQSSNMIFTNGDFYPRNFIELPAGKIVVIDWEGREDYKATVTIDNIPQTFTSQRNALINYLENHAAFFFVHMWGNYSVQKDFIKKVTQKFNLSVENLQAAIIIKSLEQALAFGGSFLALRQAEIFVNALGINYIRDLLS